MDALFGGLPDALRFIVAFLVVLGLIGAAGVLWRRFGGAVLKMPGPQGRQPRLAIVDAASVDARRRLVLIRRDNTEHLLMIGGPTDIVIEPNIVRGSASGSGREPWPMPVGEVRQPALGDGPSWPPLVGTAPRATRAIEAADPLRDEPARQEPSRLPRDPLAAEPIRAIRADPGTRLAPQGPAEPFRRDFDHDAEPMPASKSADPLSMAVPEPARVPPPAYEPVFQTAPPPEPKRPVSAPPPVEPTPAEPRRMAAPARVAYEPAFQEPDLPPPVLPPPLPSTAGRDPAFESNVIREAHRPQASVRTSQSDENNLAEMAQRLEAALRRPTRPVEPVPPVQLAPPPPAPAAPPVAPASPPPRTMPRPEPAAGPAPRAAALFEPPARPPEPVAAAPSGLRAPSAPERSGPPASLESEIASLLGRPAGKT